MKRLLSVVAILVLAASLLPVKGQAGVRGAFDFISNGDELIKGKLSPALRGGITSGTGASPASPKLERWLAFVTLSSVPGSESTGEIWLYRNIDQAPARGLPPVPLKRDPAGIVSYVDPAWSWDGKWLAYVQTDNAVNQADIYIQQYDTSTATDGNVALGSPILIAGGDGKHHRHPAWKRDNSTIAYDSDAFGLSVDLWSVEVSLDPVGHTATVNEASRTRHQLGLETDEVTRAILNGKAEFKPAWSPDGTKIAYVTNRFGPQQIQLLTVTANGLGETVTPAETNPALITHDNPSWSSNGLELYYDAPGVENPANPQDIFKLTLATGQKCNIFVDLSGDVDPDVSQYTTLTSDGIPYNYFLFISQAAGFGVTIWRGQAVYNCVPALPAAVVATPSQLDLIQKDPFDIIRFQVTFPQVTKDAGFVCRALNAGGEGIRVRATILASPTVAGIVRPTPLNDVDNCASIWNDLTGETQSFVGCLTMANELNGGSSSLGWYEFKEDTTGAGNHQMTFPYRRAAVAAQIVALNLVDKYVPLEFRAYSNRVGRQFLGFGYVRIKGRNHPAGSNVVLDQNSPNPFNPVTQVKFAVDKPGNVDVRVFNTRGELVRTIANQWYPQGMHEVSWDGKTQGGGHAPSGIYYIRAQSGGSTSVIKAVLAK